MRSRWNIGKDCPCRYKQLEKAEDLEGKPELQAVLNNECKTPPKSPKPQLKSDPENQETKKTLIEKVRERIKERMEAQKIEDHVADASSNLKETKTEREDKKPIDESGQIAHDGDKPTSTSEEHRLKGEQICTDTSHTVTLSETSPESSNKLLSTGDKGLTKEEKDSNKGMKNV